MNHDDHKEKIKKICDLMGEDLDSPACQAMMEHINACPTCKVYYDTMKKTVFLCRENDCPEEMPGDVKDRLFKVLNLEAFKDKYKNKDKKSGS